MSDAIIVAILSFLGTLIGTTVSNKETKNLILYRIEQLENKVHKHNNLIERTYVLEADVENLKKEREEK